MKKLIKAVFYIILGLLGYVLLTVVLSLIPVHQQPNDAPEVEIFLLTNGVHTDIVFPYTSPVFEWRDYLDTNDTPSGIKNPKWVAMGWGDKGFYLDTPEWKDLKPKTAFLAVTGLSESAMHVTYYQTMQSNKDCVSIKVSEENYRKMCLYVLNTFDKTNNQFSLIATNQNYGQNDVFYEAKGSYHLFKTCNTWTNNVLKNGNQRAALFTLFDFGIFYHYD